MKINPIQVSRSGELVLIPPKLPAYLSDAHELKPIVDTPTDEGVKAIHAVIRSQNTMANLPKFHDLDLTMQLSQHLFAAQMAMYRASYSTSLLPRDQSVYTPPTLPSHIPSALKQVVGTPSDEDIRSTQSALRDVDGLANNPRLFDADLSMKLSQHLFNLQFAKYRYNSSQGQFVSETEGEKLEPRPVIPQRAQEIRSDLLVPHVPDPLGDIRNNLPISNTEKVAQEPSDIVQLGQVTTKAIKDAIKDATNETKGVLESINRMLLLIKRDQITIGGMDKYYHVYKNPVNKNGVAASERGLPRLVYGYYQSGCHYNMGLAPDYVAGYLKFFGIGDNLLAAGEVPKLMDGKEEEAKRLLLDHMKWC